MSETRRNKNGLSCCSCGWLRTLTAECESSQSDQRVHVVESEGSSSDETDLGVERFDECVGETVFDGDDDRGAVFTYASRQADELCDPTTLRPCNPSIQRRDGAGSRARHLAKLARSG